MRGSIHLASGWMLGTMLSAKYQLDPSCIISCAVGSVFADTDTRKSFLGRIIPLWRIFRPHRKNILHSPKGLIIVSSIWCLFTMSVVHALVFALGYLTHLVMDTFTRRGIPWKWPDQKMFSIAKIKAGSLKELLILLGFYTIVLLVISSI